MFDGLQLALALVVCRPVEERLGAREHHADVPRGVAHEDLGAVSPRALPDVVLLQAPVLRPVSEGEVERGSAVAGVEDGCQPAPWRQALDHDVVHHVVDDGPALLEVHRVDALVHAVDLVTVQVLLLSAMAGVVEEQRVSRSSATDQPLHSSEHVFSGRDLHGVVCVVREDDHVALHVSSPLHQERLHVSDVVDAASKCVVAADVVDADQKRFPLACARRKLEVLGHVCARDWL